jgi:hypothetical protein
MFVNKGNELHTQIYASSCECDFQARERLFVAISLLVVEGGRDEGRVSDSQTQLISLCHPLLQQLIMHTPMLNRDSLSFSIVGTHDE